jgi:hypothetical protein
MGPRKHLNWRNARMSTLTFKKMKLPDEIVDLPRGHASSVNGGWGFFKSAWNWVKENATKVAGAIVGGVTAAIQGKDPIKGAKSGWGFSGFFSSWF